MTAREKLQAAYELAFHPPRLHRLWEQIKTNSLPDAEEAAELVDMALLLHQALPEEGFASQRALHRLAHYQARARAFGMVCFLRNVRKKLGRDGPLPSAVVPGHMVRDIGLPPLARRVPTKG